MSEQTVTGEHVFVAVKLTRPLPRSLLHSRTAFALIRLAERICPGTVTAINEAAINDLRLPQGPHVRILGDLHVALTAALPFLEQLERSDRVVEVVEMCREALRRAGQ